MIQSPRSRIGTLVFDPYRSFARATVGGTNAGLCGSLRRAGSRGAKLRAEAR